MDYIIKEARRLSKFSSAKNPFEICESIGINVVFADIGSLKGMYKYIKRNRYIVISDKLDDKTAAIVCAHELGHDRFHREFAKHSFLREYMMYDSDSKPEYEANLFAAELLIDDSEVVTLSEEGYNIDELSTLINTDKNLLFIKLSSMNKRGYKFNEFSRQSDFLGK